MRMIKFLSLCVAFTLAGCVTTAGYQQAMDSWMGESEEDLINQFGAPNTFYETADGKRFVTYRRIINYQYNLYCQTTFTLVHGKISSIKWKGTHCKA